MSAPRTGFGYLDEVLDPPGSVLAMAHRGGGAHPDLVMRENTMAAFEHAAALGYRYLETDVHLTSDGVLVALHDALLDRVCDLSGPVEGYAYADLTAARIGGREPIATLAELLEAFPDCRFNIDIKAPAAAEPLARLIGSMGAQARVCVASFEHDSIRRFRKLTGAQVATASSRRESIAFLLAPSAALARRVAAAGFQVLQLPRTRAGLPVVTAGVVRRAHAAGVHVHVWTVDEPQHIRRMIEAGVDGIFTDRTDVLKDVLVRQGRWRDGG